MHIQTWYANRWLTYYAIYRRGVLLIALQIRADKSPHLKLRGGSLAWRDESHTLQPGRAQCSSEAAIEGGITVVIRLNIDHDWSIVRMSRRCCGSIDSLPGIYRRYSPAFMSNYRRDAPLITSHKATIVCVVRALSHGSSWLGHVFSL